MSKNEKISVYKRCFVPYCKNSTTKTPDKNFFYVPKENLMSWCIAAGYTGTVKPGLKICEDHLEVETALVNYRWWRTMGGRAKLVSRPPPLKNIGKSSVKSSESQNTSVKNKQSTQETAMTEDLSFSPERHHKTTSDSECDICKTTIGDSVQYYCVQCSEFKVCAACERDAHNTHYLLRVPRHRPKNEIVKILRAIRELLGYEDFLPTEYLSLSTYEKEIESKEPEFTEIEFLEDEDEITEPVPRSPSPDVVEIIDDDNDNLYLISDSDDHSEGGKDAEERDNVESAVLIIDPKNVIGHKRNSGLITKPPRRRDSAGIWSQHQRAQSLDDEATKVLVELVSSKKYQDMFKAEKRYTVWQELSREMIKMGYQFGTRDAARVCAQKWRNFESRLKRKSIHDIDIYGG